MGFLRRSPGHVGEEGHHQRRAESWRHRQGRGLPRERRVEQWIRRQCDFRRWAKGLCRLGRRRRAAMSRLILFAILAIIPRVTQGQAIPRAPDGKPNFTGVWAGPGFTHREGPGDTDTPRVTTYDPAKMSPFKPGGDSFMNRRATGDSVKDDPTAGCLPNGLTRQILSPYAQQWIQTPTQIVVLYEYMHFFRVIPTDGRTHAKDVETTWMGDSVGKWEGDTLVIDTVGLKEWMLDATHDSKPDQLRIHSAQIHVI